MQQQHSPSTSNSGSLFSEGESAQFANFLDNLQDASEADIVGGTNLVLGGGGPTRFDGAGSYPIPVTTNGFYRSDESYTHAGSSGERGPPYPTPIPAPGTYPSSSYPNYPFQQPRPGQSDPSHPFYPSPQYHTSPSHPYNPQHNFLPPLPSTFQPPPTSQPPPLHQSSSYPLSFSSNIAALPLAAQNQIYEQERLKEQERAARMARQKKDLEEWMLGRVQPPSQSSSASYPNSQLQGEASFNGKGKEREEHRSRIGNSGGTWAPPATQLDKDAGAETMRSLREAEIRAGLVSGGKNSGRSSSNGNSAPGSRSQSVSRTSIPPPPPLPPTTTTMGEWSSGPPQAFYRPPLPASQMQQGSVPPGVTIRPQVEDEMMDVKRPPAQTNDELDLPLPPPSTTSRATKKSSTKEKPTPSTSNSSSVPKKRQSSKSKSKADDSSSVAGGAGVVGGNYGSATLNPGPASTPSNIPLDPNPYRPPAHPLQTSSTSSSSTTKPASSTSKSKSNGTSTSNDKPALLSAAQKKANHIASEQKRRAAIRLGYEGLCSVVPSLRIAVEEFEERLRVASRANGAGGAGGTNKKKRNSAGVAGGGGGGGALMGGIDVGGEKVDGRAGPKSEAVVLVKSVDYIRELLQNRQQLLNRLSAAYQLAEAKGVRVEGGPRLWDRIWDEEPIGGAGGEDEDEDWSEEEE